VTDLARRKFLIGAVASLGVAASRERRLSAFQAAAATKPNRIDIHHHFAPPAWVAAVKDRPLFNAANARWSPAQSIDDMDRGGVAAADVSIQKDGLGFGDRAAPRLLARACQD
jgi:hypothetical protein